MGASLLLFILSIFIVLEYKSGFYLVKLGSNTEPMTSNFAVYLKFVHCKHRNNSYLWALAIKANLL